MSGRSDGGGAKRRCIEAATEDVGSVGVRAENAGGILAVKFVNMTGNKIYIGISGWFTGKKLVMFW